MKDGTGGFMSSSGVCNIVMTSFLGNERSSAVFIPVFTPLDVLYLFFSFFWPQTAPFSVKITQNVSRPAAVSRCLIGRHSESISLSLWLPSPLFWWSIIFQITMLHYPRLGITPPSTIFWGIYSASTTVSVVCCCPTSSVSLSLLSLSSPPLKLILLVEPALCWLN